MAYFLTQDQVYRVIQRELPPDVYPDGPASAYFATADNYSMAKLIGDAYVNLQDIYFNYWPESCGTKLTDWEVKVFGVGGNPTLTNAQRISRIIAKIRSLQGISVPDMLSVVYTILDSSVLVEIGEWGNFTRSWMIGYSQLGIETYLASARMVDNTGANACDSPNPALSPTQIADERKQAYTYEVLIYGYTLTAAQRSALDAALSVAEPARSTHIITDGLDPANMINPS